MFAWDIVVQRSMSCLIGVYAPPTGGGGVDWGFNYAQMEKPALHDPMRVSGLPFGEARTQMAYECLNRGYSWLFQLDSDIYAPANTITRLMSHKLPIVSGLYYQRFPTFDGISANYLPCMFNEARDAQGNISKACITEYVPGSLVEALFLPGGCLLVHRSVFEKLLAAGIKRFFEWTLHADNPSGGLSEDFKFTKTAKEVLGIKSFCDTSIVAIHETAARITNKGLQPKL